MAAAADDLLDHQNRAPSFVQTTFGRNILLGGGIALVLAIMAALWMWSQQPEYRVLFANYSDRDGGAITAALDQMGVQYKFSDGGTAILVQEKQVHDIRLKLAAQGLPKGGNVGFELMENQKLGVSQFLEQVNYQRSLEGELARSIQALAAVSNARVHLALPKPSVFVREAQKPTASVLLNLQPGRALEQTQVSAIVHLVASSVPELTVSNVTVVDQNGNLLSDTSKQAGKQLDPNQLKYVAALQQGIVKQVESIITPLVGAGNVRAEATADVDFAQVDTAAETYKPNSPPEPQAIRSQQTSEAGGPGTPGASGIPGALSNQPPGVATAPLDGAAPPPANGAATGPVRKDATTNYEVDKTIRYEQRPMGAAVKRLTVGVVVNYRRLVDPKTGRVTVRPLAAAEVAQINELVKQAMGFSPARGDTLNVTNAPFDGVDKPAEAVPAIDWWRDPENLPLAKEIGKYALILAIIAFLYFRILRPLLRQVMQKFDRIVEVPDDKKDKDDETQAALAEELEEVEVQQQVQGYRANLQMAKDLARDDPRVVANVIKSWVGANE